MIIQRINNYIPETSSSGESNVNQPSTLNVSLNYTSTNLITEPNVTMADIKNEEISLTQLEERIEKLSKKFALLGPKGLWSKHCLPETDVTTKATLKNKLI